MLKLKLQNFSHLMQSRLIGKDPDAGEVGWKKLKWLDDITNSIDLSLSKLQEIVRDREAWCAEFHGLAKSQMQLSD